MTVSVIMSTYAEYANGALAKAVYSVLAQTYPNWELIIVGDNTPYSAEILQWLQTLGDRRIFFKNLPSRAGISSPGTVPKQAGIACASGELLAFLDADNEYFPRHLECSIRAFQRNPQIDLVYGDMVIALETQRGNRRLMRSLTRCIWEKPEWSIQCLDRLKCSNFLDMSEPVFTRAAYNGSGGLLTGHHAADWKLWLSFINAGYNHFQHSPHLGLCYNTSSLKHHLYYIGLMLAQKSGIRYTAENVRWMQKSIRKRFEKKYKKQ